MKIKGRTDRHRSSYAKRGCQEVEVNVIVLDHSDSMVVEGNPGMATTTNHCREGCSPSVTKLT